MLVGPDSTTGSNQTLGPLQPSDGSTRPVIGATNVFNFETETGSQALSFEVAHAVSDSDDDGMPDDIETNDGIYISPTRHRLRSAQYDTDGDSFEDGDEVSGTAARFCFQSEHCELSPDLRTGQLHQPGVRRRSRQRNDPPRHRPRAAIPTGSATTTSRTPRFWAPSSSSSPTVAAPPSTGDPAQAREPSRSTTTTSTAAPPPPVSIRSDSTRPRSPTPSAARFSRTRRVLSRRLWT